MQHDSDIVRFFGRLTGHLISAHSVSLLGLIISLVVARIGQGYTKMPYFQVFISLVALGFLVGSALISLSSWLRVSHYVSEEMEREYREIRK